MAITKVEQFQIGGVSLDEDPTQSDSVKSCSLKELTLETQVLQPNRLCFTMRRNLVNRDPTFIGFDMFSMLIAKDVVCKLKTTLDGNYTVMAGSSIGGGPVGHQLKVSQVEFKGKIVSASIDGLDITCVACSNDVVMSTMPHCNCFTDMTLEQIVKSIIPSSISSSNKPRFNKKIPYVVQYNETNYNFLVRLAKQYGEFFYYDINTNKLVFGQIPPSDPLAASDYQVLNLYDDFYDVKYDLQRGNPNFVFSAFQYSKEGTVRSKVQSFLDGDGLYKKSKDKTVAMVADATSIDAYDYPNPVPFDAEKTYLDSFGVCRNGSVESKFVTCKSLTYRPDLHVGTFVTFKENPLPLNANGVFFITSSKLSWNCNGTLTNAIVGMGKRKVDSSNSDIYPTYFDVEAYPRSTAQRALVLDNIDPKKMGRVQVKFLWQKNPANDTEKAKFPWIRIAQPYGGNQKGCFLLPEIGEEVMVGFEHENMEKPFVIGTLYHGADQAGEAKQMPDEKWVEAGETNKGNEVKAFRTKKGHTIEFHDVDGDGNYGYIRIYNKNKDKKTDQCYEIVLSSEQIQVPNAENNGKEDYQIKSSKDEGIEAGKDIAEKDDYKSTKLRLMVRSNGGDIVLDAGAGDIIMNAKNIRVHATGDATTLIDQKNIIKVKGDQFLDVKNHSLVVQEKQNIVVKGEDHETYKEKVSVEAEKACELKTKSLSVKSNEKTLVNAADVEITGSNSAMLQVQLNSQDQVKKNITINNSSASLYAPIISVGDDKTNFAVLKGNNVSAEGKMTAVLKNNTASLSLTAIGGSRGGRWNDN